MSHARPLFLTLTLSLIAAQAAELPLNKVIPKIPAGYEASIYAQPPAVSYPTMVSAAGNGDLYVAVDKNASLSKEPHAGSILRLVDTKGKGVADHIDTFVADVDSPRGLYFDGKNLFCLHPPTLTVYTDTKGVGKADKAVDIVTGIGYGLKVHPADHTTNGIRLAIDGWIYMAIGDFGVPEAKGPDGKVLTYRGGGVLRVRPDGTELEVYANHTRNIYDVSVDPYLNTFIYDNTNDGDGWNSRFSHTVNSVEMGYPSLYKRFIKQAYDCLADFGGGSAVGNIYIHEPGLPGTDGDGEFICDWGTSSIYRIPLTPDGASFAPVKRQDWAKISRVTDLDIDGNSKLYASSWIGGSYKNSGPNVGAIIQLRPTGTTPAKFPDLANADNPALLGYLTSPSAVCRQQTQNEILRRGPTAEFKTGLSKLAKDTATPLDVRIAALFTLKSLFGIESHPTLLALTDDPTIQEWALRALADRKTQLANVPTAPFLAGLKSSNPRVQVQAMIGLARLGKPETAAAIVPFTAVGDDWSPARRLIPHIAVRTLLELKQVEPVLAVLAANPTPEQRDGALWVLKWMHDEGSVKFLIDGLKTVPLETQKKYIDTLAHLYYREGEWDRKAWWTTRPEHQGPYFQRASWAATPAIEAALKAAAGTGDELAAYTRERIAYYLLKIPGFEQAAVAKPTGGQTDAAILAKALAAAKAKTTGKTIGNLAYNDVVTVAVATKGDPAVGKNLFTQQGCIACHTVSSEGLQKGPNLGDIANQYSRPEVIESIIKPSAVIAQGFATRWFELKDGTRIEGFVTQESAESITVRNIAGVVTEIDTPKIANRGESKQSMMPEGLVNNLTPEELASLLAYFESIAKK
jgi:putative heme-binding domain-containing protein